MGYYDVKSERVTSVPKDWPKEGSGRGYLLVSDGLLNLVVRSDPTSLYASNVKTVGWVSTGK